MTRPFPLLPEAPGVASASLRQWPRACVWFTAPWCATPSRRVVSAEQWRLCCHEGGCPCPASARPWRQPRVLEPGAGQQRARRRPRSTLVLRGHPPASSSKGSWLVRSRLAKQGGGPGALGSGPSPPHAPPVSPLCSWVPSGHFTVSLSLPGLKDITC